LAKFYEQVFLAKIFHTKKCAKIKVALSQPPSQPPFLFSGIFLTLKVVLNRFTGSLQK